MNDNDNTDAPYLDDPSDKSDLVHVFIGEGGAVEAVMLGEYQLRAVVIDYNVEFPIDASTVKRDADGDYYKETIV